MLLIGLDGCDPFAAERLVMAGRMPHLAGVRRDGAWGQLLSSEPLVRAATWTTIATGRHPEFHDVLIPYMPRPDGGGVIAIGHAAWRAPAIWEVLASAGRPVLTVGWPATWPGTAWPGLHVDTRFATATGPAFDAWAMRPGCVSPIPLRHRLRDLRLHPADVTGAMLAPFVPRLREVDQYRDARLTELAVLLAETTTLHSAATALIATEEWDLACVNYPLLAGVQARYGQYAGDTVWGGAVEAAYGLADAMLGRLLALAGPEASVWVVSPTGVRMTGGGAVPGNFGLMAARGRWIEPGTALSPAPIVNVAPTVLARFGLSIETNGAVIRPLAPGRSHRPVVVPPRPAPQPARHVEALREAGYSDTPSRAQRAAMAQAEGWTLLRRGEALIERRRVPEAEAALGAAREKLPDEPLVLRRLASCAVLRGDAAACVRLGDDLIALVPQLPWGHTARATGFAVDGDKAAAWADMIKAEQAGAGDPDAMAQLGGIALIMRESKAAIRYFSRGLELEPHLEAAQRGLELARALEKAGDVSSP